MCIIICVPSDKPLPTDDILNHCWVQNPDLGGFMYVNDLDRLVITKCNTPEQLIKEVKKIKGKFDTPIVIHMRYATNGIINLENAHPFRISKDWAFAHNGSIYKCATSKADAISDTRNFLNTVLKKLPGGVFTMDALDGGLGDMLDDYIGQSKLVFMNSNKEISIINKKAGDVVGGLWFSNDWYKKERRPAKKDTTKQNPTRAGALPFSPISSVLKTVQAAKNVGDSGAPSVLTPEKHNTTSQTSQSNTCGHCSTAYGIHKAIWLWDGKFFWSRMCPECRNTFRGYVDEVYSFQIHPDFRCLECDSTYNEAVVSHSFMKHGRWQLVFDFDSKEFYSYCGKCSSKRLWQDDSLAILAQTDNEEEISNRISQIEEEFINDSRYKELYVKE